MANYGAFKNRQNIPAERHYHRGHYYGTISPYNPKMVDNVQVYRSGFHAGLGDRVGGAVLIESSDLIRDESVFGVGANTLFSMAYAKMALSPTFSLSVGGRHSWGEDFSSPKLDAISESIFDGTAAEDAAGNYLGNAGIVFADYHLRANARLSPKSRLSVSGIYTHTRAVVDPIILPDLEAAEENGFKNVGTSVAYELDISTNWKLTSKVVMSRYSFLNTTDTDIEGEPLLISENIIEDFGLHQQAERTLQNGTLTMGVDTKWQSTGYTFRNVHLPTQELVEQRQTDRANVMAPFVTHSLNWKKWYVNYGLRTTYYSPTDEWRAAPRILLNYEPVDKLILKSSFGLYNQFLSQIRNLEFGSGGFDNELWRLADSEEVRIVSGRQFMSGFVYAGSRTVVDVEYFVKDVRDITLYEHRRLSAPGVYLTLDQGTYGVDMMVKRNLSASSSVWVGYSYHDSKLKLDTARQVVYGSKFVQPHVLYVGSSVVKQRWKLSAGWRYSSGLNAQSLDIAYAEVLFYRNNQNLPPEEQPPGSPFDDRPARYSPMHFLDVSSTYLIPRTETRKWNASLGLSLLNILDQKNLTDQVFKSRNGFVNRYAVGFAPNLMLIVEW